MFHVLCERGRCASPQQIARRVESWTDACAHFCIRWHREHLVRLAWHWSPDEKSARQRGKTQEAQKFDYRGVTTGGPKTRVASAQIIIGEKGRGNGFFKENVSLPARANREGSTHHTTAHWHRPQAQEVSGAARPAPSCLPPRPPCPDRRTIVNGKAVHVGARAVLER